MKISIITATYNSAATLGCCMDSVLGQDYSDIEYIIVDGESKDDTLNLVRERQRQPHYLRYVSGPDQGIYDALNKGIQMATGDLIGFVHSDDMLASPQTLSDIANAMREEEVDGVYADLEYVQQQDTEKVVRAWKSRPFHPGLLQQGWMPAHPTFFLRKSVYNKHGFFNLDYRIAADYEFMLRVLKDPELSFFYLPQVVTKMRVGGASNRSLANLALKSREDLRAMRANKLRFPLGALLAKNISKIPQFFGN